MKSKLHVKHASMQVKKIIIIYMQIVYLYLIHKPVALVCKMHHYILYNMHPLLLCGTKKGTINICASSLCGHETGTYKSHKTTPSMQYYFHNNHALNNSK